MAPFTAGGTRWLDAMRMDGALNLGQLRLESNLLQPTQKATDQAADFRSLFGPLPVAVWRASTLA